MVKPKGRRWFRRDFVALVLFFFQAVLAWAQPTVSLDNPPSDTVAISGAITLEASASDADGILRVEFRVDGSLLSQDSTEPYEANLITSTYGDGTHTISVTAVNVNLESSAPENLITVFDNSGPTPVTLDNPASGTQTGAITMSATAFDPHSSIDRVEFLVDGILQGSDDTAPYTFVLDTSVLADGNRNYQAQAYNGALLSVLTGRTLLTDNSPPNLTMVQPTAPINSGTVRMEAIGVDSQTGITVVEFLVDGVVRGTDSGSSPYVFDFNTVTAGLPDGTHNFQIRATNGAGLQAITGDSNLVVDNTPPVVSLTNPGASDLLSSVVTITADATDDGSDITQVQFVIDGANVGAPVSSNPYQILFDTASLSDGAHTIRADATNGAGMVTSSTTVNVTVDNTAPTVSLDQPAAGPLTGIFLMQASASDGGTGVSQVEFLVDGTVQATDNTAPYQFSFASGSAGLSDGSHSLQARATDGAGNQTTDAVSFVIDNTAPVVTLEEPNTGPLTGTFVFRANASDPTTAITEVRFYIDGGLAVTDTIAPYEFNLNTVSYGLTDASHTFRVEAENEVGLIASDEDGFIVDNSAPGLTQTGPPTTPNPVSGFIDITADAVDLQTGITQVEFLVDGVPHASMPPDTTSPYGVSFDTAQLVNGAHVYQVRATNGVGIQTTSGGVSLTSDNTAPTVTLDNPSGGGFLTGQVNLVATAADGETGVTQVEFRVDGTSIAVVTGAGPTFTFPNFDTSTLTDGAHIFVAETTNGVGLTTASPGVSFDVDNSGPIATLNQPSSGPRSGSFDLIATASDATSGVTQVEFFVDGVSQGAVLGSGPTFTIPGFNSATLADGTHDFTAIATNGVSLTTVTNAVSVIVDNSVPTVSFDSPLTGTLTGSVPLRATAADTVSGIDQVEFFISGVSVGTTVAGPPYQVFADTTAFGDGGPYPFLARATNGSGLTADSSTVSLSIDNSPPTVNILNPAPDVFVSGVLNIDVTSTDLNSGVTMVEFFVDGGVFSTVTAGPPWNTTLDTTTVGNGDHALRARATNGAGQTAVTPEQDFVVDNTAPSVFLTNPGGLSPVSGTISLAASALDFESGIERVEFYVDLALVGSANLSPFTTSFDTSAIALDGDHDFQARAYNRAGLNSQSTTVTVMVDNSIPVVSMTTPTPGISVAGNLDVAATASDPHTAITEVAFLVDGVVRAQDTSAPYEFTFATNILTDGSYSFQARATNQVGLEAFTVPVAVNIDNSVPEVALTSPLTGFQTGIVNFNASASDPDSGIAQVDFLADGANFFTDATAPYVGTIDTGTLSDGPHSFTATARNSAGRTNASTAAILVTDNSPPSITWTAPSTEAVSGFILLQANAVDDHSGITQVEFFQDGGSLGFLVAPPFEFGVDTTVLTQGTHDFAAVATNGVGMTSQTSPSPALIVDNSEPFAFFTTPTGGAFYTGSLPVQVTVVEPDSSVRLVEIFVDGNVEASLTAPPFDTVLDTSLFADGDYTFEIQATNASGLTTFSTGVTVTFDNSAPTVSLTSPTTAFLVGPFEYQATAFDFPSGIARVDFLVDGVVVGSDAVESAGLYTLTSDSLGYSDGSHTLSAQAVNGVGLASGLDSIALVVDNSDPTGYVSAPTSGPLSGTVLFQATVDDPHSGIQEVEFLIDGVAVEWVTAAPFEYSLDTTTLSDATHDFSLNITNGAGLTLLSTAVTGILVDNSAPVVAVTTPVGGGQSGTFTFSGTATDAHSGITQVEFLVGGVVQAVDTTFPYSAALDSVALGIADGPHDLRLRAVNGAGITTTTTENLVFIDNTAPIITQTSPVAGSTLGGNQLLEATASDAHSGITQVEFLIDGLLVATDCCTPYSVTTDTTTLTDGNHDFQARATNGSGLSQLTTIQTSLVDNSAPAVALTSPTVGPLQGTFPATATASDPHSGITLVEFLIDDVVVASDATGPYEASIASTGLSDGNHAFQARALNGSGLSTLSTTATIMIDNSAPTVSLTSPTAGPLTGNLPMEVTAADGQTGITQVEFLIDGAVVATDATSPYQSTVDTSTLSDGVHNFQARASNGLAATAMTGITSYVVDNSPPVVTLTAPTGADTRGTISLAASASDAHTAITQVEFLIDGVVVATDSAAPYELLTDTTTLSDGSHDFQARATNGVSLTTLSAVQAAIVDNSVPTVSLVSPSPTTSTVATLAVMPTARTQAMGDRIGNSFFVAGGQDAGGNSLTTLEEFRSGSGAWAGGLSPMAQARSGAFHGVVNGKLVVAGGRTLPNTQTNSTETYDPLGLSWTTSASVLPVPRERGASVGLGDRLYAIGGLMGSATATGTVDVYAETTGWTSLASMPTPRYAAAAVAWEDDLYVIGGHDGAGVTRTVEIYDSDTNSWRTGADMLQADSGHAAFVVGRRIYTLGGSAGQIQAFDPLLGTWSLVGPMPAPVVRDVAWAPMGANLYVAGGTDGAVSNVLRRFTFPEADILDGILTLQSLPADAHSGITSVSYLVDGATVGSVTTAPFDFVYDTSGMANAFHDFRVLATNGSGLTAVTASQFFYVHNTAPLLTLTHPTSGAQSQIVTMTATASDQVRLDHVEFLVDGAVVFTDPLEPFSYPYDSSVLADGTHNFQARATGASGLQTLSPTLNLAVDNTAPTVTLDSPVGPFLVGSFGFAATASDGNSGIQSVDFLIDGVSVFNDVLFPYATTYDTLASGLPDGSHNFQARATNFAGLPTTTTTRTLVVDNSPPVVTQTFPALTPIRGSVNLTATATDAHSGINVVTFYVDGVSVGTDNTNPYSLPYDTVAAGLSDGAHSFQVQASNGASQVSSSVLVSVVVDNSDPTVSYDGPLSGPLSGTIVLTGSASDPHTAITQVEFLVDGAVVGTATASPFSYTYDSVAASLSDGNHDFSARSTNAAGGTATSAATNLMVDNSGPVVTLTSPSSTPIEGVVTFSATATDAHTGVTQVEFLVDGTVVHTDTTTPYSFSYDLRTLANGAHNFQARGTNGVNLTTLTPTTSFVVANPGPPDLTLGGDGEGGNGSDVTADDVVLANGFNISTKTVTIRDAAGKPIFDVAPVLTSSRTSDVIVAIQPITDSSGRAIFQVTSTRSGTSTFTASLGGVALEDTAQTIWTNVPPTANAGANQTVDPSEVTLDGTGSNDPNGDALSYLWVQTGGLPVPLVGPDTVQPKVTLTQAGVYTFQLTVSDGLANDTASVNVTVNDVAPVADAGNDFTARTGVAISLDGTRSADGNGDPLTFLWTEDGSNPALGLLSSAIVGQPSLTPPTVGIYRFNLVVNDGSSNSPADQVVVTVNAPANLIPTADAGPDLTVSTGSIAQLDGSGSRDPDGSIAGWAWFEDAGNPSLGLLSAANVPRPTVTPPVPGTFLYELQVTDNSGNTSVRDQVRVVSQAPGNGVPIACAVKTSPSGDALVGSGLVINGSCSGDPDGDALTYTWDLLAPMATSGIGSAAILNYTAIREGNHRFRLTVNDGTHSASTTVEVPVVTGTNGSPSVVPSFTDTFANASVNGSGTSQVGAVVTMDAGATDPDADPLSYLWEQLTGPSALLSSPASPTPTFSADAPGSYQFRVHVSDPQVTIPGDLTINISGPGFGVPVAVQEALTNGHAGEFLVLSGVGSYDPDGDPLTHYWNQLSGTPVVLTNPNSETPSFVPPAAGEYVFEHQVFDGTFFSEKGYARASVAVANTNQTPPDPGPGAVIGDGGGGGGGGCSSAPGGRSPASGGLLALAWLLLAGLRGFRSRRPDDR